MSLASLGLLFTPQFNLLNYYFALAVSFVVPLVVGMVVAALPAQGSLTRDLRLRGVVSLLLLAIPLVFVGLGAFMVKNCAPMTGLVHYLVGPGVGALVGLGVGTWAVHSLPRLRSASVLGVWLALVLANFYWFYTRPPIFAYHVFVGFLNGAIYDPVVRIHDDWAQFRWLSAGIAALWLGAGVLGRYHQRWGRLVGALVFVLAAGLTSHYQLSAEEIENRLGGRHETEHFVIIYDAESGVAGRIDALADDHEFRYHQLVNELGLTPRQKITSFVYAGSDQKQRMMGAGRTYIAKPWSRMVHLNNLEIGAPVLKHELVHVFGAELNDGWLGIPTRLGLFPRMAIVEGFAVAFEWARGRLSPHQWSAAMRELGIAPPLASLLSERGFFSAGSSKAYTLTGSFLRYLLDSHGLDALHALYSTGDFALAYGKPLAVLVSEWEVFVDDRTKVPLSRDDIGLAEWRFDSPSRFFRVCALEIADWERKARDAAGQGEHQAAIALYEKVYAYDRSIDKEFQLLEALVSGEAFDRAQEMAGALADDDDAGATLRARARQTLADIEWRKGQTSTAHGIYSELSTLPLDLAKARRNAVARYATSPEAGVPLSDAIRRYLVLGDVGPGSALKFLETLRDTYPDDGVVAYLYARRVMMDSGASASVPAYQRALELGLPDEVLTREAMIQLAHALRRSGDLPAAERAYRAAGRQYASAGYRYIARDWAERCAWLAKRAVQ